VTARELMDIVTQKALSELRLEGDGSIVRRSLFPELVTPSPLLARVLREQKPMLVEFLMYQHEADRLLLESTHRLAQAWPPGCPGLDEDAVWAEMEKQLTDAYWMVDLATLREAIERREEHVLAVFAAHRDHVRAPGKKIDRGR